MIKPRDGQKNVAMLVSSSMLHRCCLVCLRESYMKLSSCCRGLAFADGHRDIKSIWPCSGVKMIFARYALSNSTILTASLIACSDFLGHFQVPIDMSPTGASRPRTYELASKTTNTNRLQRGCYLAKYSDASPTGTTTIHCPQLRVEWG